MEQICSNELISSPPKLKNELGPNSDSDPNTQAHHDNSELPINKVILDVLYNIFTLAVYGSNPPEKTVLNISHVCRHWRKSSLEWPALWAFINLRNHPSFVDIFMKRSGDVPLAVTCYEKSRTTTTSDIYIFSNVFTVSPRICSLTLHIASQATFITIHDLIKHSQSLPLQLRRLDINLWPFGDHSVRRSRAKDLPLFTKLVDIFYLRELYIRGFDLPFELPHRNLTHLTIWKPINLPPFSQLLVLLSNCPLLEELVLDFDDSDRPDWETIPISSSVIRNRLDLPRLSKLSLFAAGNPGCCYIRQFSRHLQPLGSLSRYMLGLSRQYGSDETTIQTSSFPSVDVFLETIPSGIIFHLSNHHYLCISLIDLSSCTIFGDNVSKSAPDLSWPAFYISASEIRAGIPVDYTLFLKLAHAMPRLTHLKLRFNASQILTQLDIHHAFSCLHTLELDYCRTEALNTLSAGVNLKTLILRRPYDVSSEMLFDLVSRMGIDVLEVESYDVERNKWAEVISALRSEGVVVRVSGQ